MTYKELQAAIKDINKVLLPHPLKRVIAAVEVLQQQIVTSIDEAREAGDPRLVELQEDTMKVYQRLKKLQQSKEPSQGEPQEEEASRETQEEEEDCFGVSYDADNPLCTKQCAVVEECRQEWLLRNQQTASKRAPAKRSATERGSKKGVKREGVIESIVRLLSERPHTKAELVAELRELFPERTEKALKGTVNVQIHNRLQKDKGLNLRKDKDGRYYID